MPPDASLRACEDLAVFLGALARQGAQRAQIHGEHAQDTAPDCARRDEDPKTTSTEMAP
jgi:hypothetical protein